LTLSGASVPNRISPLLSGSYVSGSISSTSIIPNYYKKEIEELKKDVQSNSEREKTT